MDKAIALRVITIKNDPDQLNTFIEEYKPFIASCVQKSTGKFVEYGRDDELSIGLLAFHEAIKSYDQKKGNFLTFASQVIRRRLIDYYRTQKKFNHEISIEGSYGKDDPDEEYDFSLKQSIQEYSQLELERARRAELEELKQELKHWGINFFDVAQASPKQEGTRRLYLDVIKYIISDASVVEVITTKRYLPIAKICERLGINRKKIERGRNYIVAGVLIMLGEYEFIRDFVNWR
ncbi:MAG: polymerase sigma factor [Petroclostridium sp.]|jgi:RNA polymerase sigma factor|nr:polymerase sigma factor [Petroclostridium sp.]